jgi:hypothetical protein
MEGDKLELEEREGEVSEGEGGVSEGEGEVSERAGERAGLGVSERAGVRAGLGVPEREGLGVDEEVSGKFEFEEDITTFLYSIIKKNYVKYYSLYI